MTANRSDRDLPAILEDLYLGPSPDYRHEALAAVRRTRQRPPWTFPGRWLPMADIAQRSILAPRVRWRAAGLALLVIALLLVVAALVAGSRQTRLPHPFGLAGNGLIAYAINGDIYTIDPASGRSTPIVTGPDNDFDPVFSADGIRVAFRRDMTVDGSPGEAIVVAAADGSNPVVVTDRMDTQPGHFEWMPSSRSLLVEDPNGAAIWQLDALTPAEPRVITTNASMLQRPFRPPEGDEVLIQRSVDGAAQVVVHNLASGEETVLAAAEPGLELGGAAWSPDGDRVIYLAQPADEPDTRRLFIVNANGTGEPHQIPGGVRNEVDIDPTWSNDGSRIAFIRWEEVAAGDWQVRPIMLYTVATNTVTEIGPRSREVRAMAPNDADKFATAGEGLYLEFSPDATRLIAMPSEATGHPVVVDPDTGRWQVLDVLVKPGIASNVWQRIAAP